MNVLGQVYKTVWSFYNDLNPATLSGAIDVVIVEQEDGSFLCSPFHVRFGKRGVFNRREKIVDITINDEPVDLHMKLGETGEAFFVEENTEDGHFSPILATSPLPDSYLPSIRESAEQKPAVTSSKSLPVDLPTSGGNDTDSNAISVPTEHKPRHQSESPKRERHESGHDSDRATSQRTKQKSKKRRKIRTKKAKDDDIFHMDLSEDDADGEDGKSSMEVSRSESLPDLLEALSNQEVETVKTGTAKNGSFRRHRRHQSSIGLSANGTTEKHHVTFMPSFERGHSKAGILPQAAKSEGQLTPPKSMSKEEVAAGFLSDSEVDLKKSETRKVNEDEASNVNWQWGQLPEKTPSKTAENGTQPTATSVENFQEAAEKAMAEVEKRSYFRGVLNIWRRSKPVPVASSSSTSTSNEPKEAKKTPEESGMYLSDLASADQLSQSQKEKYLALGALQESSQATPAPPVQPAESSANLTAGPVHVEGTNIDLTPLSAQPMKEKVVEALVPHDARSSSAYSSLAGSPPVSDTESERNSERGGSYRKTLRLTSEQIRKLPLAYGQNEAEFCIVTKYQGSARCRCHIFLWRYDDKIVISDIDGTITKSDVLGHILPIIGSTWAQAGVAGLYNRVARNGYKFLYLSSRAIGQASFTRDHLKSIIQEDTQLPEGPLLLSPKSLFLAFHQEVIVKRPEEFKIACLQDIRALFPADRNPFFAAYGNKTTDLVAYRAVGVPPHRIFTINYQGQLKQEIVRMQSSYSQQTSVVDMLFPPLRTLPERAELVSEHEHADSFSLFTFWREPLPEIDIPPPPEVEPKSVKGKKKETLKPTGGTAVKSTSPVKGEKSAN